MGALKNRRRLATLIAVGCVAAGILVAVIALAAGGGDEGTEREPATTSAPSVAAPEGKELEALADGVILAGFDGKQPDPDVTDFAAVLVRGTNWDGKKAGAKLIAAIRDAGSKDGASPPLIAVAQEGGAYRALEDLPPDEREVEIGDTGDPERAGKWMAESTEALHDVGFDLDLAPVADVATLDSPIADRAFSDDAVVAAEMTAAAVQACGDSEIACAPAHFPGLGGATQDTAAGPASVGLDAATLAGRDLLPFQAAFKAGAPAVVVSSAFYSAYDPVTPASLTPAITTDLLREDLGFEGVAISDDLTDAAITAVNTPGDAAVRALGAGIDLVQVSDTGAAADVRKAIVAAVEDGTLDPERLREAARRVEDLRRELGKG